MTIEEIARWVRREAEAYARLKGYCDETLVTLCGVVSSVLVDMLEGAGHRARLVCGRYGEPDCSLGHFWVIVGRGPERVLVDPTATQFDGDVEWPAVVILPLADARAKPWRTIATGFAAYGWIKPDDCDEADELLALICLNQGCGDDVPSDVQERLDALLAREEAEAS